MKDLIIKVHFILIASLIATINISVNAHHGGEVSLTGPGVAGPIITIPARTLPKGKFFIGTGINYLNFDQYTNSEILHLDNIGEHIHGPSHIFTPSLNAGYGLTDDLFLAINLPYIFRYDTKTAFNGIAIDEGNSIGFGDITVFGEYRFFKNEKNDFHSAILSGIKIPSGVRRTRDNQGLLFEADEQPGTGSWDPIVGFAISKGFKHLALDANGLYTLSTEGTQDTIVGDMINFNIALSHRINGHYSPFKQYVPGTVNGKNLIWDLIFEANGQWSEKPEIRMKQPFGHIGIREENHGGLIIYLTPGIRLTYDEKWVTNLAIGLSTIEDLNGIERTPSLRLVFGLIRIF